MSIKTQQVESVLKRAVSEVLVRKLSDPRILGLVSVTRVSVSPDLAQASVYVSVLPDKYEKRTLSGLRHAGAHIQSQVKQLVDMRTVPHLDFRLDEKLKKETAVLGAIQRGLAREKPLDPSGEHEGAAESHGSDSTDSTPTQPPRSGHSADPEDHTT